MAEEFEKFRGYCMKCRKKDALVKEGKYYVVGNNRSMLKGPHVRCGSIVCRVVPKRVKKKTKAA